MSPDELVNPASAKSKDFRPVSFVDAAPVEVVEGVRYSVWREVEEGKGKLDPRLRAIPIALSGMYLISIAVLWLLGALRYVTFLTPIFVGVAAIVVHIFTRDLRRKDETLPHRPEGVPGDAVPVMVVRCYGQSNGWLWTDGPWVIFHGDRFDFRLHPGDFAERNRVKGLVTTQDNLEIRLNVPKGHPTRLFLSLGYIRGLRRYQPSELATAMRLRLAECLTYDRPVIPSLFPPYRKPANALEPMELSWRHVLAASLLGGVLSCILPLSKYSSLPLRFLGGFGSLLLIASLIALIPKLPPYNERIPEPVAPPESLERHANGNPES